MNLESLREQFAPHVQEVEDALARYFDEATDPANHYGLIRYHLGFADESLRSVEVRTSRGKRLRPVLCLLIGRAVGAPLSAVVPLMLAAELMHNASIVHDDIQDREHVRWGRPTVWSRFGIEQAINVGDALIGHFYERLIALRNDGIPGDRVLRILDTFNSAHIRMAEGQHLDITSNAAAEMTVDGYLDVISRKTAAACECMTHAAALLAGRDGAVEESYRKFGHAFGMLYQICDDIHSVWAGADETGKRQLGDVILRKATLPILYGLTHGSPALRELLLAPHEAELGEGSAERIRQLMSEAAIDEMCRAHAVRYRDLALAMLRQVGDGSPEHNLLETMTIMTAQMAGVPPPT